MWDEARSTRTFLIDINHLKPTVYSMCPLTLSLTDALFSKQCCTIILYPSFKYLRSRRDCVSAKIALNYPTNSQFYNSICIKLAFFIFTKMLYNIYFEFLLKRQSFTVDRSHFNKKNVVHCACTSNFLKIQSFMPVGIHQ